MVGDTEVLVAERLRAPGHLEHRGAAVAPIRMRVQVALVGAQIDAGLVVARRLAALEAKPFEVGALARFDQARQHLGNAFTHPFDRGELLVLEQRIQVRPLERNRPGRCREGARSINLLGVLPQQISDLRKNLRGGNRVHPSIV